MWHISPLNTDFQRVLFMGEGFWWARGWDVGWTISVSVGLFITAKLCECWHDVCVIFEEGLSFKGCNTQYAVFYITSQICANSDFSLTSLPIRMGSSKVQYGLDWLFNNKHPHEWKSQKQLINMLVFRIGYKPLSFMRYHLSIKYNVPSSFYSFPLILYDSWLLSLYLCKAELRSCSKGLMNWNSTICHALEFACFTETLN